MKIVHLVNSFSRNGGVGNYVLRLSRAFLESGHDITVIHSDSSPERVDGLTDYQVGGFGQYRSSLANPAAREVLSLLEKEKPDIVHIHANENYALEAQIRSFYPTVKSMHVFEFCPSGSKFHHFSRNICEHKTSALCLPRMIYKRCTLSKSPSTLKMFYDRAIDTIRNDQDYPIMIAASHYVKDQALLNKYPESQVEVVPYFTEPIKMLKKTERDEKIILFSCRVVKEKGWEELIRCLFYLPRDIKWHLMIDGDGPDLEAAKRLAKKLRLSDQISFLGWVNGHQHYQHYVDASVVVVPSIWPEPFGLVGIEAMGYGKPVVGFAVGGIKDWLHHGKNGYLVNPYDVQEMARKIEEILRNPKLARTLGETGRELAAKEYSAQKHLQRLNRIYKNVIELHAGNKNVGI